MHAFRRRLRCIPGLFMFLVLILDPAFHCSRPCLSIGFHVTTKMLILSFCALAAVACSTFKRTSTVLCVLSVRYSYAVRCSVGRNTQQRGEAQYQSAIPRNSVPGATCHMTRHPLTGKARSVTGGSVIALLFTCEYSAALLKPYCYSSHFSPTTSSPPSTRRPELLFFLLHVLSTGSYKQDTFVSPPFAPSLPATKSYQGPLPPLLFWTRISHLAGTQPILTEILLFTILVSVYRILLDAYRFRDTIGAARFSSFPCV